MLDDILSTLLVFLSSANREIVKSTLGFIKLAVPNGEAAKVVVNIKKRKDRSKRKMAVTDGIGANDVSLFLFPIVESAYTVKPHASSNSKGGLPLAMRSKTCCIVAKVNRVTATRTTERLRHPGNTRLATLRPVYD